MDADRSWLFSLLQWVPVPQEDAPGMYWALRQDGYWHVRRGRNGPVLNPRGVRYERALELAREAAAEDA